MSIQYVESRETNHNYYIFRYLIGDKMVIAHNMAAMNAQRQYGIVTTRKAKSTEKLSSGYKINRAADDAAGLTISEKMRSQIRGLTQASENCQDGISLVQIGDGAMAEVQDMLHRMTELSVKSANGTNTAEDRNAIQKEINQLLEEIDNVAHRTEFNTLPILLGDTGETTSSLIPGSGLPAWVPMPNSGLMKPNDNQPIVRPDGKSYNAIFEIDFSGIDNGKDINELDGTGFHFTCCTCNHYYSVNFNKNGKTGILSSGAETSIYGVDISGINTAKDLVSKIVTDVGNHPNSHYTWLEQKTSETSKLVIYDERPDMKANGKNGQLAPGIMEDIPVVDGISEIIIQAGTSAGEHNEIEIKLPNLTTAVLGIRGLNVSTDNAAKNAIRPIEKALAYVSAERSKFGAYQNRMEHTIKNLDNVVENTQAAESQIRDTDMAKEMVNLVKENILMQANEAMMAQANQSTQGVLSLLQ